MIEEGKYLVINAGSSSLKFSLYSVPSTSVIVKGQFEKIGRSDSFYTLKVDGKVVSRVDMQINNHQEAVNLMINELLKGHFINDIKEISGVGHRVLHGGEYYDSPVIIDDEVLGNIIELTKFGPLHHPGEIAGIESMREALPNTPQVAVFDTSFHQTMPQKNFMYAIPYELYEKYGIRKYGFHGTSHKYIKETIQKIYYKNKINLIICHIGNGASISCIKDGECYDTTMGLTPLAGLIMGTRSGTIDPSLIEILCNQLNKDVHEITDMLNNESGMLGLCGESDNRDISTLADAGDEKAKLALEMFEDSIVRYIAQYYFELNGRVDAIVFTAGVGENSVATRKHIIEKISPVTGIILNEEANKDIGAGGTKRKGKISSDNSRIDVFVIPTDEECMILEDTYNVINTEIKGKKRVKRK